MNEISRRRFLFQLGAAGAAGLSTPLVVELIQKGGLPFAWGSGESDVLPSGSPICVHVALNGGNDYLNTLVPVQDGFYRDASVGHGPIALSEADTLALTNSTYRLHNGLPWLASRWNTTGDVGFVLGVGNLATNFSHFDSMKFWETARVDGLGKTGWLGRFADAVRPNNSLASVSIADLRWDAMGATAPVLVLQECKNFAYQTGWLSAVPFLNGAKQMATIPGGGAVGDIAKMMNTTFEVAGRISAADDPAVTGDGSGYASLDALGKNLVQAAQLIKAGLPAQSYTMAQNGYDSHADQKNMQSARFRELDAGLSKFFSVLAGHPRQNDVFVLITSEFGRQGTANKDNGTDHGQAGMAIFIGGGTKRGVYGQAPTLDPGGPTRPNRIYDALRPTVDFRSVHATALARLAKGDSNVADAVLGKHFENLAVFAPWVPPTTTTTTTSTTTTVKPTTTTTTAPNKAPVPSFTINKTSGLVGMVVAVDASASKDPDGWVGNYRFEWGDGTAATLSKTATHKFTKRGTFTVRLTVSDNYGKAASTTKTVRVF